MNETIMCPNGLEIGLRGGDRAIVSREFRALNGDVGGMHHPVLGKIKIRGAVAPPASPIRRAWLWCKCRPWMMFIIGVILGQALLTIARML